jgi:type II secretory pathway pseudopilin PulG
MIGGASRRGYTIVEVMIFLAVSGGLLTFAALFLSGKQARTEFAQSIRDTESQIQDIINDVATGYYANTGNFQCTAADDDTPPYESPAITAGTNNQGANLGCIFVGRAVQFAVAGSDSQDFNIYTIAGRQKVTIGGNKRDVETFDQARPRAIAENTSATPPVIPADAAAVETRKLSSLRVMRMTYKMGVTEYNIGAVGFVSAFGKYASSGSNLVSGDQRVDLVPIADRTAPADPLKNSTLNQDPKTTADRINALSDATALRNPEGGVIICFEGTGTNQHGILTIGSNGRQLTTELAVNSGSC